MTGVTGQDGSFLAELLLGAGYQVTGMIRPPVAERSGLSEHLRGRIELVAGDLLDPDEPPTAVARHAPGRAVPPRRAVVRAGLMEATRARRWPRSPARPRRCSKRCGSTRADTRVFVAGSGAMFGAAPESPQREDTPCRPETPYATAKLAAHQLVGQLRGHDGLFACSGILYNHESERRPESFVTRKITRAAAAIKLGLAEEVELGDLSAVRDWSFAGDVMRGAWLMLQQEQPDDYILSSGAGHTVAEFAEIAFARVGLRAEDHIQCRSGAAPAARADAAIGDPSRARTRLGWRPTL